jgi:opacity protein-like surface antigen
MMKTCWGVMFAMVFAASMCSAAQWAGRPYVGGGALYSIERFNSDVTSIDDEDESLDLDFKNSWGVFAKGGYFLLDFVAVEALARYHHEYKASESENVDFGLGFGGVDVSGDFKIKGYDLTLNAKGYLPLDAPIKPYGVIGGGYGRFKATVDLSASAMGISASDSESDTESGPLARIGGGCDVFLSDNVGLEVEASYNKCFSDLEGIKFVDVTLGMLFAF